MSVETVPPTFITSDRPAPPETRAADRPRRVGLALCLAAAVILCAGLGVASVSRTQEARVLETAREMLGGGTHNWMIPKVNGHIRLQKPPLAYWLTALCYKALGVSEGVGRIPAAVTGAMTIGLTGAAAAWLFGRRAGFLAGAALLGSFLFYRHARLAETDILITLFVTAAVYALWRGYALDVPAPAGSADVEGSDDADVTAASAAGGVIAYATPRPAPTSAPPMTLRSAAWFHAAGAAIGLAVLAKGPPAAYPVLFFVLLAAFDRQWRPLLRFVTCGAPVTAALIALPWFLYVRQDPDYTQLAADMANSARGGRGRSVLFFTYIPPLFAATAPWSVLWVVALVAAIRGWRTDRRLRGMVIWVASILVPLSFWGNKQFHYLMPVMPPLMILVGWLLDESVKTAAAVGAGTATLTRRVVAGTAVFLALGAPALVLAAKMMRGWITVGDVVVAALVVAAVAVVWFVYRSRGPASATAAFAAANAVALAAIVGFWEPSLTPENCRTIAPELERRYGNGPYVFVGKEDLPMVFHMRRIIPTVRSDAQMAAMAKKHPDVVAIEPISGSNRPRPTIVEEARFKDDKTTYRIGRINVAAITVPATAPSSSTAPSAPAGSPDPAAE